MAPTRDDRLMTEERTGSGPEHTVRDGTLRHDLLTPVNHIIGYGEMLQEEAESQEGSALAEGARTVLRIGREVFEVIKEVKPGEGGIYRLADLQCFQDRLPGMMESVLKECRGIRMQDFSMLDGSFTRDLERIEYAAGRLTEIVEQRVGDLISNLKHLAE